MVAQQVALSAGNFSETGIDFVNLVTVLTGLFDSCGQVSVSLSFSFVTDGMTK
jgi:hypothetical protein